MSIAPTLEIIGRFVLEVEGSLHLTPQGSIDYEYHYQQWESENPERQGRCFYTLYKFRGQNIPVVWLEGHYYRLELKVV